MIERKLLLGDEAIALGAVHAGISGVYAYPGTPSTEITEYIQGHAQEVRSRWCTNEKTAMEAALGMSYAGKRALVCMKHVGMNVAADAFVNSAITGVNGGLVVLAADDPSMHSSQNEQVSRFYGKFAMIPILEPSTQQEAYDMMAYAFALSEEKKLPVLMRVVTRLAHSRAGVVRRDGQRIGGRTVTQTQPAALDHSGSVVCRHCRDAQRQGQHQCQDDCSQSLHHNLPPNWVLIYILPCHAAFLLLAAALSYFVVH